MQMEKIYNKDYTRTWLQATGRVRSQGCRSRRVCIHRSRTAHGIFQVWDLLLIIYNIFKNHACQMMLWLYEKKKQLYLVQTNGESSQCRNYHSSILVSGIFHLSVTYNSLDLDQLCTPRAVLCEPVLKAQRKWLDQE